MMDVDVEIRTLIRMYHDAVVSMAFDLKIQASPKKIRQAKEWHDSLVEEIVKKCDTENS